MVKVGFSENPPPSLVPDETGQDPPSVPPRGPLGGVGVSLVAIFPNKFLGLEKSVNLANYETLP
jgi:hypothetical protein